MLQSPPGARCRGNYGDNDHCCRGNFSTRPSNLTYPQWEQIRAQQAFSSIFAWAGNRFDLATGGEVQYVEGLFVSGACFNGLGVVPLLGLCSHNRMTSLAAVRPAR